jgi:hypothetical protein
MRTDKGEGMYDDILLLWSEWDGPHELAAADFACGEIPLEQRSPFLYRDRRILSGYASVSSFQVLERGGRGKTSRKKFSPSSFILLYVFLPIP